MQAIPYARQSISEEDIKTVEAVLRSDWLTQGPAIPRFEEQVAATCGAQYAVATCNATAALHLACRALDLTANDQLWTVPNSFVASANCARYCQATVGFVDINPATYNMDVDALASRLAEAKRTNTLPKIVVPVHFAGQPCEMANIAELAKQYGFAVLEDASHAIGATYRGTPVGSGRYSDVTIFSFHPVKIITTGEGGMLLTNQAKLRDKATLLRSHGITRDVTVMESESEGSWYYQQIDEGYNYRMTDIQAALGVCQLAQLDHFIARRRYLAARYTQLLTEARLPLTIPWQHPDTESAWHLYVIQLDLEKMTLTRRQVVDALRQAGILVNVHYIPIHTQPYYQRLGFRHGDFPVAENYYERAISLPMYYDLSDEEQMRVVSMLSEILQCA